MNTTNRCIGIILATALLASPQIASAQSDTSRRITSAPVRLSSTVVDFGDLRPNQIVTRTTTIENQSDQPIRIRGVRVSCGCTVAEYPEEWIQPGENAEIELSFSSGDLWGPVQRYALLQIEGYNQPMRITTVAHVNHGIRPERRYDPLGQTLAGTITLHSTDGTPFRVLSVSFAHAAPADDSEENSPGAIRSSELDPALAEAALRHELPFDLSKADPDHLRRWIAIETDHPTAPVVAMHIDNPYAGIDRRRQMWMFSRDFIMPGLLPTDGQVEHRIGLRGLRSEVPLQLIELDTDKIGVELLSTEMDPAEGMVLHLRFTPTQQASGLVHARLRVRAIDYDDTIEVMLRVAPPHPTGENNTAGN